MNFSNRAKRREMDVLKKMHLPMEKKKQYTLITENTGHCYSSPRLPIVTIVRVKSNSCNMWKRQKTSRSNVTCHNLFRQAHKTIACDKGRTPLLQNPQGAAWEWRRSNTNLGFSTYAFQKTDWDFFPILEFLKQLVSIRIFVRM